MNLRSGRQLGARFFLPFVVILVIAFFTPSPALAQTTNQQLNTQQPGGLDLAEVSGKIEGAASNQIKVLGEDGQTYFVIANQQTNLTYSGTADRKLLTPGMLVRFSAGFDPLGMPTAAVNELEIFKPVQRRRMTREFAQRQTAGVYPIPPKKAENKATASNPAQDFFIVGRVLGMQGDRLAITAGNRTITIDLTPDATLNVTTGDLSYALPGDEVKVSGLCNSAQKTYVQAESIDITGAKPLALPENPLNKKRQTRRSKKPDTDKEPGNSGNENGSKEP